MIVAGGGTAGMAAAAPERLNDGLVGEIADRIGCARVIGTCLATGAAAGREAARIAAT